MPNAVIVADSIANGVRLTTMALEYERFIHAEFMTHRMFSRNAGSSRAKPVAKVLEQVRTNPAMPIHWGKNEPGMQANQEHDALVEIPLGEVPLPMSVEQAWRLAAYNAATVAECMAKAGYHKQVVNRLLEPFQMIQVVVSSTEWENFFMLRDHEMAQPEIRELAIEMKESMNASKPVLMSEGGWHLPFTLPEERTSKALLTSDLCKISAARCARVSYQTFDGQNPKIEEDLKLYDRLAGAVPAHLSPLEHVACAADPTQKYGNFTGWRQLRQMHEAGELQ